MSGVGSPHPAVTGFGVDGSITLRLTRTRFRIQVLPGARLSVVLYGGWVDGFDGGVEGGDRREERRHPTPAVARQILEQVSDALVVVNGAGSIVFFNSAAEMLFGYRGDQVVGGTVERLVPVESADVHDSLVRSFVRAGGSRRLMAPGRGLVMAVRRDGTTFPAAITVGPIDLGTGEPLAMAAVRDQTQVVEATQQLLETSEQLARRNEELEQFLWSASHDLREPLRKVQSFADELAAALGDDLDEWSAFCLERTVDAGRRMGELIEDLIGYGRLTVRERVVEPVDLSEVVVEVLGDLSLLADEAAAEISVSSLPTVRGDRVLLRHLFQNVIGNAIKFHRPGVPPIVQIAGVDTLVDHSVGVVVQDQGIGIDAEHRERAFEPFQRLGSAGDFPGTGMGLTIARKVAEIHGGTIEVSAPSDGVGTRMTITLAIDGGERRPKETPEAQGGSPVRFGSER